MFRKSVGGSWLETVDLPEGALSISIRDGGVPMAAVGYRGRIELRYYDAGEDAWFLIETIVLAAGDDPVRLVLQDGILAAVVNGGSLDDGTTARIYQDDVADWNQTKVIEMEPPPEPGGLDNGSLVQSVDLSGTRLAIGSGALGEVWIHEQSAGGPSNWGRVAVVAEPAGHQAFGISVALEVDQLAVASVETTNGKPEVTAFSRNTGGTNAWGTTGTVLESSTTIDVDAFQLEMSEGRMVALGLPNLTRIFTTNVGAQAWFFSTGAGPGGWIQDAKKDLGRILTFAGSGQPLALDGTECFLGLADEEYLDSHGASWVTCVHRRGTGAWNLAQLIEGPGSPQEMGTVLAMGGPFLVAGMPGDDGEGTDSGAVMVWLAVSLPTNGDRWFPVARLQSPSPGAGQRFGASVAVYGINDGMDGCWVAVGAPGTNSNRGAAYLYRLPAFVSATPPVPLLRTPAAGLTAGARFGESVALGLPSPETNPSILAVGAPGTGEIGTVYLFKQDLGGANAWGEWRTIPRPAIPGGKNFGDNVAIGGTSVLAVSQPRLAATPGCVHLFSRNQGGVDAWGLLETKSPPAGSPDRFAESLAASRYGVVVGAPGGSAGKSYYYIGSTFALTTTFTDPAASPEFGAAVSISDYGGLMVGDPAAGAGAGRIHAWALTDFDPLTWSEHFKKDGGFASGFGTSVGSGLIYYAGGAPFADGVGNSYGEVNAFRAGSYEMWAASQGTGFNAWYPEEDADGDGQENLVEFALGSNPRSGATGLFQMHRGTYASGSVTWPAMIFVRPTLPYPAGGLHFRMEGSTDLGLWKRVSYELIPFGDSDERYFRSETARAFFRLAPKYPDFVPEDEGLILVPVE